MKLANAVLAVAAIAPALAGCGGFAAPTRTPAASELAVFIDRESGFSTNDVYDAQDQVVRFSTAGELIWAADGTRFGGYIADGAVVTAERLCAGCYFLVRFGKVNGEPRAYLTWTGDESPDKPATVLDVDVAGARLTVNSTGIPVPRN